MGVKAKRLIVMLRRRSLPAALPLGVAAALACVLLHMVNVRLHPVLTAASMAWVIRFFAWLDAAVDNCLQQQGLSYADFITIERDGAGKVASMTSNTAANSRFKRQVVEAVARRLSALDSDELGVPLGTLTGQPLLSGAGPSVRVRVDSVGEVTADYENLFTSAGVNQTLHQVNLKILATVYLFLPGEVLPVSVSSTVCVAETVIVGETPDTYLNLEKGNG